MPLEVVSRAVQSSEGAFQFLELAFVINLLPLGQFQSFQHVFHFIERVFQFLDDFVDLLDGRAIRGWFGNVRCRPLLVHERIGRIGSRQLRVSSFHAAERMIK
jgi:hypothetical protein